MGKRWTLYAHREFTRALRQIPRGLAGLISESIGALADNPLPAGYEPLEEYENRYCLNAFGYLVCYEVIEETGIINLLLIEEETPA